jgi:hypothetical protein
LSGQTGGPRQLLLKQLLGNAFPQDSKGSFRDNLSHRTSNRFRYRLIGGARLDACTLQQIGEQFSLWHTQNAFIGQQSAGETIDHLSCCHQIPPGEKTLILGPGQSGKRRGLERSKKKCKREVPT